MTTHPNHTDFFTTIEHVLDGYDLWREEGADQLKSELGRKGVGFAYAAAKQRYDATTLGWRRALVRYRWTPGLDAGEVPRIADTLRSRVTSLVEFLVADAEHPTLVAEAQMGGLLRDLNRQRARRRAWERPAVAAEVTALFEDKPRDEYIKDTVIGTDAQGREVHFLQIPEQHPSTD